MPRNMNTHNSEPIVFGLLAVVFGFLVSWLRLHASGLPEELCAGIIFILIVALVGILLVYDARVSWERCACALVLCSFVAVVLLGLIDSPHKLRAALFGTTMISDMERDVTLVLGQSGLADAAALLRSKGVFNLETMQVMAGEDVDLDKLLELGFPFATAQIFIRKRTKLISDLEYRARVRKAQGDQNLYDAAREYRTTADSFKKMRELIQKGSHPDGYKNKDGWSALIWASCNGHVEVVRFLLDNGANADIQGLDGWSALLWASHKGYAQVASMLLDKGANTDLQGESGGTALTRASDRGHESIVRLLLERGADVDMRNTLGYTALMWGCARGHFEVVKMLLDKAAKTDLSNIDGDTALIEACRKGHSQVVKLLLERRKILYSDIQGALPIATHSGHHAVVKMLEEHDSKMREEGAPEALPAFVPPPTKPRS